MLTTYSPAAAAPDPERHSGSLSIQGASRVLGTSELNVRQLLYLDRIPGYRIGHTWILPHDEFHEFLREARS